MKIYTKTGDSGETSLFDKTRVSKADARVDAYGEVDELNACLGAARAAGVDDEIAGLIEWLQKISSRWAPGSPIRRRALHPASKRRQSAMRPSSASNSHRPARRDAAAAAPVYSSRRVFVRRAASSGANGLPPSRAARHRARCDCRRTRAHHLLESPLRPLVCHGSRGQSSAPASRKPNGEIPTECGVLMRVTAQRAARRHYENFPVASFLLPRPMRPHVAAVYAFARAADDFADEDDLPAPERLRLIDGWEQRLHAAVESRLPGLAPCAGEPPETQDLFLALGESIRSLSLPVKLFEALLSAFRQDVTVKRYRTWDHLMDYCQRSANPVGRLVLRIAGYRRSESRYAHPTRCARPCS